MMGSHLMGGAPLPPMTNVERARFEEGITLRAKVRRSTAAGAFASPLHWNFVTTCC